MSDKPCAPACERNREPILAVLQQVFDDRRQVLEIGSGTGQHAVFFGTRLPHLVWQTSDVVDNHAGIRRWLDDEGPPNVRPPLAFDTRDGWPVGHFDAVFSANTLHIMDWDAVRALFAGLPGVMTADARLVVYGPFHIDGRATSDSNARFDASLRAQPGSMGIRDLAEVDALAAEAGLRRIADHPMPANNRCVVWEHLAE